MNDTEVCITEYLPKRGVNPSLKDIEKDKQRSNLSFTAWALVLTILVSVILYLNTFVFMYTEVVGSSMYPTLKNGNVLVANRLKEFKRGDIVIIDHKEGDKSQLVVKRVIALEGDSVTISNGVVQVNGQPLKEDYAFGRTESFEWTNGYTLQEGEVFYLGDNREVSLDSRLNGVCNVADVIGVVENWSVWLCQTFL